MRNRIRLLVIALLTVLSLAACGNEGSGTATVNMKQLQQAMLAAAPSLSETASTTGDAADAKETFSYVSDLPYDKVENFLLSYSTTGKADEIAVIAVKDPADVTKAADSLRAHVESRRKLFLQYGPAEAARVEKAQVFTKDQDAVLIICDDSPAVKTAFDDFLPSSDTEKKKKTLRGSAGGFFFLSVRSLPPALVEKNHRPSPRLPMLAPAYPRAIGSRTGGGCLLQMV